MRRTDRIIGVSEARKILKSAQHGVLSLVSPDASPYGIPLSFVLEKDSIYFHCATKGEKIDIISSNSQASFCAIGKTQVQPEQFATQYESAIATGKMEELFTEQKKKGLLLFLKKYSPEHMDAGLKYIATLFDKTKVFRMDIESLTGKARR